MAEPLDLEAIENRLDFGHRDSWTLLEEVKRLRAEVGKVCAENTQAVGRLAEALQERDSWVAAWEAADSAVEVAKAELRKADALTSRLEKARTLLAGFRDNMGPGFFDSYPSLVALRDALGAP